MVGKGSWFFLGPRRFRFELNEAFGYGLNWEDVVCWIISRDEISLLYIQDFFNAASESPGQTSDFFEHGILHGKFRTIVGFILHVIGLYHPSEAVVGIGTRIWGLVDGADIDG